MRFLNENTELPEEYMKHLQFVALQDNSTIYFTKNTDGNRIVYYSYDKESWTELPSTSGTALKLNNGDKIYCRAAFTGTTNYSSTPQFKLTGKWKFAGNLRCLLYDSSFTTKGTVRPTCAFSRLFYGQSALYDVSELDFGGTTSSSGTSMTRMFYQCKNIEKITCNIEGIASYDLQYMFYYCSNLSYIAFPNLKAGPTSKSDYFTRSVSSSGTFVKVAGAKWLRGEDGIPTGWTVIEV